MKPIKKIIYLFLKAMKWTIAAVAVLSIISALYNLTLPSKSEITERLQEEEKAYIGETFNLHQKLGNAVWPGWSRQQTPVIVYNEAYAFLIGYPNPPEGWKKMPREESRGSRWEEVKDDDFFGTVYYRQHLPNPDITPENFTVKVGNRWVATMQTSEYAAVKFYNEFKEELPPLFDAVFPYKIFWHLLMGEAENYIGGITHEAFHAFQGATVPQQFAEGENASRFSGDYPWENSENAAGWEQEIGFLLKAYRSADNDTARYFVDKFLEMRNQRREKARLSPEMISYEKNREWLEGLAKYAELSIGLEAEKSKAYKPVKPIEKVSGFKKYKTRTRFFNQQIGEVKRTVNRSGESRFYYVGMLQALMLDRLLPDWKTDAFKKNAALDDLLKKAV